LEISAVLLDENHSKTALFYFYYERKNTMNTEKRRNVLDFFSELSQRLRDAGFVQLAGLLFSHREGDFKPPNLLLNPKISCTV